MTFKEELKAAFEQLTLKIIYTIQSRKFWALVFGLMAIFDQLHKTAIDGPTAIWSAVSLIVAYSGMVVIEDVKGTVR